VQRADWATLSDEFVCASSLRQSVVAPHTDDGVQLGVDLVDSS
jgi:hypothetical protein